MPRLMARDPTQRGPIYSKMHPIKALAVMWLGLTALCYALPMPSDKTVSYIKPKSKIMTSNREAREETVEDGDSIIGLRA